MFYEHERFGSSVMRPMLAEFPLDKQCFKLDDQYMLSDKILVHPVLSKGARSVNVFFPSIDGDKLGELWYDMDDNRKIESVGVAAVDVDMKKTPVYQKGGTIIPKKEIAKRSSVHMVDDPISLFIAVNKEGKAQGTLYIDDEESYNYRRGKYLYLEFYFNGTTLTSKFIDHQANFTTKSQLTRIVIAGRDKASAYATLETSDGKSAQIEVIDVNENYFTIQSPDVNLGTEWSITLSGAGRNVFCSSLVAAALMIHIYYYVF